MHTFSQGYPSPTESLRGEKLFVGNLPCDATEAEIWSVFAPFGQILEVFCLGPNKSQSGQACAFIRYAEPASATAAIQHLDGRISLRPHECPALTIQVRRARGSSQGSALSPVSRPSKSQNPQDIEGPVRLFVGNLPMDITADELHNAFRSSLITIFEAETFIMFGRNNSANAVCAFVVAINEEEAKKAIVKLDGKLEIRGQGAIKVRGAYHSSSLRNPKPRKNRAYSDSLVFGAPPAFVNPASAYGSGHFLLPTPDYVNWKEPSIKTYHHYMLLPQSASYGPLNIVPGSEPWRNNGIYSLPSASYTPDI